MFRLPVVRFVLLALSTALAAVHAQEEPLFPNLTIPAISGTVVDAVTGRPIPEIDVTLRVEGGDRKDLHYENCRTSPLGRFRFSASSQPASLMSTIGEIAITANLRFVPVARLREARHEDWIKSDGGADASQYLWDPLFTAKLTRIFNFQMPGSRVQNHAYFPMAVQFLKDCQQRWNANCITSEILQGVRVPLIPVLPDASTCSRITDSNLREECRRLQTYRAAFAHVDTMAGVRAGKAICDQIDHGPVSKLCREELHGFALRPEWFENRLPIRMEIPPIDQALILAPIAGMRAVRPGLSRQDPFDETAAYHANYQRPEGIGANANAVLDYIGDPVERRRRLAAGIEPRRIELFDGSPIAMLDDGHASTAMWISGQYLVTIISQRNIPSLPADLNRRSEISPELHRALIRAYLQKYPVTN